MVKSQISKRLLSGLSHTTVNNIRECESQPATSAEASLRMLSGIGLLVARHFDVKPVADVLFLNIILNGGKCRRLV